ncbi:dipeptide ABC transporter ATP-binding protein [Kaistia dalseonensis]|uniref:Dipeptide transport system ATP-binding protein n=1 Tax=Kaistia dalseonensis TaxID=410840 RepID=A0ABU0HBV9_9HYPH|nr:dipeptide ABC transporter ATP-binding protein [Kaistia dalseonensis]MCX5496841.1 dipeptide ABC transporter ATP-binding protein [Kaistia dalseonensis]MDQ0439467.1 dipeptide transport system ATP-binding protein [Kaistia dalseonensis]
MNAPVALEASHLARFYEVSRGAFRPSATIRALAEASFVLEAGRTLAVVGESGCGKSTLARLVTMIEPPSAGRLMIGDTDIASADHAALKKLRSEVQIVFQNPYGSLNPRQKIGDALAEPLLINRKSMSASERRAAVLDMLKRVGLRPEHIDRYPHMFSGGQRQRIAIARALMLRPKILVLDEPVSALDVSVQAQVLNLLVELQESLGLSYLFISHGLSVVRHMADEIVVMYLGRIVEKAPREKLFAEPLHPYTQALLSATPVADPDRHRDRIRLKGELPSPFNPPQGCAFHPRCPLAFDRCRVERPELAWHGETQVACWAVDRDSAARSKAKPGVA